MNKIYYDELYKNLSENDQMNVELLSIRLIHQLSHGLGMSDDIFILLDNDILNSIRSSENSMYKVNMISLMVFFAYLKFQKSNYKFHILLTPLTLLEFYDERVFSNKKEYLFKLNVLLKMISFINLPVHQVGLDSFEIAKQHYENIKHDKNLFINELNNIKNKNWIKNLVNGSIMTLPTYIANIETPRLFTKYFSPIYSRQLFEQIILYKIISNNKSEKIRNLADYELKEISKILNCKNNKLYGLGDLNILSVCDISSRFFNDDYNKFILVGLTFDKKLEIMLKINSSKYTTATFIVGKSKVDEFMSDLIEKEKKLQGVINNEQANDFIDGYLNFLNIFTEGNMVLEAISAPTFA